MKPLNIDSLQDHNENTVDREPTGRAYLQLEQLPRPAEPAAFHRDAGKVQLLSELAIVECRFNQFMLGSPRSNKT